MGQTAQSEMLPHEGGAATSSKRAFFSAGELLLSSSALRFSAPLASGAFFFFLTIVVRSFTGSGFVPTGEAPVKPARNSSSRARAASSGADAWLSFGEDLSSST